MILIKISEFFEVQSDSKLSTQAMVLSEAFQFKMLMSIFVMRSTDECLLRQPVSFLAIADEFLSL